MFTEHAESAGGGGGTYAVLCLAGVLSDVGLGGFAELQTGDTLGVLQLTCWAGPYFAIGLEPRYLDLRCSRHLTLQTHSISCCHLHGLQRLNEVWWLCSDKHKLLKHLKTFG